MRDLEISRRALLTGAFGVIADGKDRSAAKASRYHRPSIDTSARSNAHNDRTKFKKGLLIRCR